MRRFTFAQSFQPFHSTKVFAPETFALAGLLAVGFVCNLLIRPVNPKYYMSRRELEALDKPTETADRSAQVSHAAASAAAGSSWLVYAAWVPVAIPLLWAVGVTP